MLIHALSVLHEKAYADTVVISTAQEDMLIQSLSVLHKRAHADTCLISIALESIC